MWFSRSCIIWMLFIELVDRFGRVSVSCFTAIGTPDFLIAIGVHSNTINGLAIVIFFLQYFFLDSLDLEHQGRDLLSSLTACTSFIRIQLIGGPVVAASGTSKVREVGQAARLRGVDENVTSHCTGLRAPDNTAIRVLLDLTQVDLGDVGGGAPANALDVVTIEDVNLSLELRLCQILLQKVRQSLNTVKLPNLAIPPIERTFRAECMAGEPTNVEVILSTYSSQAPRETPLPL